MSQCIEYKFEFDEKFTYAPNGKNSIGNFKIDISIYALDKSKAMID
jgi:hypothetical protein